MSLDVIEEIVERYIAMQEAHIDQLENNLSVLEKGGNAVADLSFLTAERDSVYREIKTYFDNSFHKEDLQESSVKDRLIVLSDKFGYTMERESKIEELIKKNSGLLSERLSKMRNGKKALNAYNRAAGIV